MNGSAFLLVHIVYHNKLFHIQKELWITLIRRATVSYGI